jgi:glycolate oxidase FAD binding subunit
METDTPTMITSVAEVQQAVLASERVALCARGTKTALANADASIAVLNVSGLRGVLEYEPGEFTFTALTGTTVAEVNHLLAENGQYLPFDPLLAESGATLGGSLAAGLSGPGRYRYGGLRDFVLGVRWVDGAGQLVSGGGKVVKNAAGFDFPKLMVGSLGQYGALVELTFKVFPRPQGWITVHAAYAQLASALRAQARLYAAPLDVDALDLVPEAGGAAALWVRLGGPGSVLAERARRVIQVLNGDSGATLHEAEADLAIWRTARELAWVPAGWSLAKVPLTPLRINALQTGAATRESMLRYSAAGNVAWLATPDGPAGVQAILDAAVGPPHGGPAFQALLVLGPTPASPLLGPRPAAAFERRVKTALDPWGKFPTR